jgi:hypothetical protein
MNMPALTPETDANLAAATEESSATHSPPSDWPAFARAMEIQRNAARAERDAAISLGRHAMFCVHHTDAERVANTVGGNCPICNKAEIRQLRAERDALRADVARLRTALEGTMEAEIALSQAEGWGADEIETAPHWKAARAALDEAAKGNA